jgi:hypothetical protein
VPGWHAKTKQLVKDQKLIVLGIAPEQHGDRMALFLQWKEMEDMVVMLDSYNQFFLQAVPITLLIDEAGVVRARNPKQADLKKFLAAPPATVGSAPRAQRRNHLTLEDFPDLSAPRTGPRPDPYWNFAYGVAHRKAYDQGGVDADPEQLTRALLSWRHALKANPNNYIWRRRLQQYGPRLDKPYPFYDWVATARKELLARGLQPHPLRTEPMGAEIAHPLRKEGPAHVFLHPDPDHKLAHDDIKVMKCSTFVVPHTKTPLTSVRVLISLTPSGIQQVKWNDEAGASTVRLVPPEGWMCSKPSIVISPSAVAQSLVSTATRYVEFELHRTDKAPPDQATRFDFQLYYNVCYGDDRVCQFFRRDVRVDYALPAPSDPADQE